ncbi:MAG: hypothetical protein Tsb009_15590 [Planctomycetaceae bacterium]
MEFQHVNIKIPVEGDLTIATEEFVPVFHQWIRENTLNELMIDVADYRHVVDGPSVLLVGHESDYVFDQTEGIPGLLYNRKAGVEGDNAARFSAAMKAAVNVCLLLEQEFENSKPLKFSRSTFEVIINDRAIAPNTEETLAAFRSEFEPFLQSDLGVSSFELVHDAEPRKRFRVTVQCGTPLDFEKLS